MSLPTPITRKEAYLAAIAGEEVQVPEKPITREEAYLDAIAKGGGGGEIIVDPTPTEGSTNAVSSGGTYTALEGKLDASEKGTASGVAELDANGKVLSSQLPSFVDDVVEGYYDSVTDRFYEESTFETVIEPVEGKLWVDIPANKSYRWTGAVYVRVDEGIQIGETSNSAFRGDWGKTLKETMGTGTLDTTAQTVIGAVNELKGAMPTDLADLEDDSTHRTVTDTEKAEWSGKQDSLTFDTTPTEDSENPVTSGGIKTAIDDSVSLKTATGNPITLTDAANANAEELSMTIEPIQSGSGDPSPTNVRPISGLTEGKVTRTGKNLFSIDSNRIGKDYDDETILQRFFQTFPLPKGTYTWKLNGTMSGLSEISCGVADAMLPFSNLPAHTTRKRLTDQSPTNTITITDEFAYAFIGVLKESGALTLSDIKLAKLQLELGSTATDYEAPVTPATATITFGQTVYGGSVNFKTGEVTVTHANIASYNGESINEPWLSSIDKYESGATPTTGAQVVYPLSTPTTLTLTPAELELLKGNNTITANGAEISIKYYPDNAIGTLAGRVDDLEGDVDSLEEDVDNKVKKLATRTIQYISTSTDLEYTGVNVSCPTGHTYIVRAKCDWDNGYTASIAASDSASDVSTWHRFAYGDSAYITFMLNEGETAYIWGKWSVAGKNRVHLSITDITL